MESESVKDLNFLIEKARTIQMTKSQIVEQRRSFAYGNTAFENPKITRAMVDEEAEKMGL